LIKNQLHWLKISDCGPDICLCSIHVNTQFLGYLLTGLIVVMVKNGYIQVVKIVVVLVYLLIFVFAVDAKTKDNYGSLHNSGWFCF